jgi:hypothetical protein
MCSLSREDALGLDHIDGKGGEHRRKIGTGGTAKMWLWAKKNNLPTMFRVLCHNCNWIASIRSNNGGKAARLDAALKLQTLSHYSEGEPTCAICTYKDIRALSIDHPNSNGAEHRRQLGVVGGSQFYRRLRQAEFPLGFRVLCYSCNLCRYIEQKRIDPTFARGAKSTPGRSSA